MFEGLTLFEVLAKGGVAVYILCVFSVVSLGVILERAWAYRNFRRMSEATYKHLGAEPSFASSFDLAEAGRSALANVLKSALAVRSYGKEEVLRAMDLALKVETANLHGKLGVLGTVGATAPFVGLFGTVIGIIRAFGDLAGSATDGPFAVADGIAEALVATATGLFVAIPAVIAYNYFVRRARRLSLELENMASEFVAPITKEEDGGV